MTSLLTKFNTWMKILVNTTKLSLQTLKCIASNASKLKRRVLEGRVERHLSKTKFKHYIGPPKQDRKQSIKNKNNMSLSFHFDLFSGCWFVGLSVFRDFRMFTYISRITR